MPLLIYLEIHDTTFQIYRKLADKVSASGFYVVVPDFFYGDPYAPENAERPLPVWLKDHGPVSRNLNHIIYW